MGQDITSQQVIVVQPDPNNQKKEEILHPDIVHLSALPQFAPILLPTRSRETINLSLPFINSNSIKQISNSTRSYFSSLIECLLNDQNSLLSLVGQCDAKALGLWDTCQRMSKSWKSFNQNLSSCEASLKHITDISLSYQHAVQSVEKANQSLPIHLRLEPFQEYMTYIEDKSKFVQPRLHRDGHELSSILSHNKEI